MADPASPSAWGKIVAGALAAVTALLTTTKVWLVRRGKARDDAMEMLVERLGELEQRQDDSEEQIAFDTATTKSQQVLLRSMRDRMQMVMQDANDLLAKTGSPPKYGPKDWNYFDEFRQIEQSGRAAVMHVRHQREERERRRRERAERDK